MWVKFQHAKMRNRTASLAMGLVDLVGAALYIAPSILIELPVAGGPGLAGAHVWSMLYLGPPKNPCTLILRLVRKVGGGRGMC